MTLKTLKAAYDVIIVGAGPAGLAAAAMTSNAGLATLLLDENPSPGGQIYRAVTTTPLAIKSILGSDYWRGAALVEATVASSAHIVQGATVWSLDRDLVVGVSGGGAARLVQARQVIIATGAQERPFPIPGWTLPGVMTVGAAQTLLKTSGLVPQGRTVIAGLGPLLWLYAAQALRASGEIVAILDTTPRANWLATLPHTPGFLLSSLWSKGLAMMREVRKRVPVVRGVTALASEGDQAIQRVSYTTGAGANVQMDVDTLLLHQGVVPNVNLAMAAGVEHHWDAAQLCWSPRVDEFGRSPMAGILVAGDGAGIGGAAAAAECGRLAAIAVLRALGRGDAAPDEQSIRQALRRHRLGRRFIDALFRPAQQFRVPADETIVCRCEEVTAGQIRQTATALGCEGPNQMKAFLRCGMGPCQGRMCGLSVTELIAQARGTAPADVGYFRLRPPVKPIALAELAEMPADESAVKAVVRL